MTRAVVRAETDVPAWREPGDTAEVRVVIGAPDGSDHLEQRVGFQFGLDDGFQLGQGQLQYLDRLLKLRRHYELLAQPQVLS